MKFSKISRNMLKKTVKARGRLGKKKQLWSLEEALLVASLYNTRGQLFEQNQNLYLVAYSHGWLNEVCAHMKPSRKKRKFVYGVLNPNKVLAVVLTCKSYEEFRTLHQGAYNALKRYGIDTQELFDNREDFQYLKSVILKLSDDAVDRLVG